VALLIVSLIGLFASMFIPIAKPAYPHLRLSRSITFGSWRILRAVFADKTILKAVLFTSWFWLCGSVFLALFPGYVKNNLAATEGLYALFLATFSVGIAAGAVACSKILKDDITPKLTAKTLVGVTVFTLLMVLLSTPNANKILLCITMFLTAFCWGIYTVPLKTIIQTHAKDENRSRIIAGENILNAAFMVAAMIINVFLLRSGIDILTIFIIIAILNLVVAIIAKKIW
jgi:predicted MFS family arabinose efflux permease